MCALKTATQTSIQHNVEGSDSAYHMSLPKDPRFSDISLVPVMPEGEKLGGEGDSSDRWGSSALPGWNRVN